MQALSNIYANHVKSSTQKIFKIQNVVKGSTMGLESSSGPEPYSAIVELYPFIGGAVVDGTIGAAYRKLFFDENGNLIKKFNFDETGRIERKESYKFVNDRLIESTFITDSDIKKERYYYEGKSNKETGYDFFNPEKSEIKSEYSTYDKDGRKKDASRIGYGGLEELFTKFHFIGKQKDFSFREVFSSNPENGGKIQMTLYYLYLKDGKLKCLYGFLRKTKSQVETLMKRKAWEGLSDFMTEWEYDKAGNQKSIVSTEKPLAIVENPQLKYSDFQREWGYTEDESFGYKKGDNPINFKASRIVTAKSTFEYAPIVGEEEPRLYQVIEWLPRYNEPLKAMKKYTYYDNGGKVLEWDLPT